MARTCTVCKHNQLEEINKALIGNESYRIIANRYGITKAALLRHRDNHLPATLIKAKEAQEVSQADNLLDQVKSLQAKAIGILKKAEGKDDLRVALLAIKEARGCLELLGKLACELQEHPLRIEKLKAEIKKAENLPPPIDVSNYIDALKAAAEDVWVDENSEINREIALALEEKELETAREQNSKKPGYYITSTREKYSPEFTEEGFIRRGRFDE